MRELILSVCQKSKDSFREKKTGIEADGRLLGAGHQWARPKKGCPMGAHGRGIFFSLGSSTDVTEKKESTYGGRWALGAAGQEKLSDNLDSDCVLVRQNIHSMKRDRTAHVNEDNLV
jgi:hypothetical protein